MKKILLPLLALYLNTSFAQSAPNYDQVKLVEKSDYKVAEASVLTACDYILSTPFEENDVTRLKSLQLIMKWMTGTPDFSFTLDDVASKIAKGNDELLVLYMTCMAKYCLENKSSASDLKLVKLNSVKLLLTYCEDSKNNIKLTKQLKKLSQANQKGELEKEL